MASKIIEKGVNDSEVEYIEIIELIAKFSSNINIKKWFQNENNLIGFSVALRKTNIFNIINSMSIDDFNNIVDFFEEAFSSANSSQVRVGSFRRKLSYQYFMNLKRIKQDEMDLLEALSFLIEKID